MCSNSKNSDLYLSIDKIVGTNDSSSADRRRALDEERTDDVVEGVFH